MRAVVFDRFGSVPQVRDVPEPECSAHGAIVAVRATGLCRSDWHGWVGHDADIRLPHVPGHEFAGVITELGSAVTTCTVGQRVTVPFVCACGSCPQCLDGEQQVCVRQTQPGFTHWGSFAELVAIEHADVNLVPLPDEVDFDTAAGLGCRFATAYRALTVHGRVSKGDWVAVHGCGGVGLSAMMIAVAMGARVVGVDISARALQFAAEFGAEATVDASKDEVPARIVDLTDGGAQLSIDALGSTATSVNSIRCLRPRGRHIQVGLMAGGDAQPRIPMELIIANELEIYGSHGMPAHAYPEMLGRVASGELRPSELIGRRITLDEVPAALVEMERSPVGGMTVIRP
ncbi:MAG: zinc-dependent alcohol dehydrogenase family protein [Actinomycetota bacterium]|nr:zinc-dependent alcohol dehydrogenase family protein [Actinomycetota bacterium]